MTKTYLIAGEYFVPERIIRSREELMEQLGKGFLKQKHIFELKVVFKKDLLKK
jgi:hypothetical protein